MSYTPEFREFVVKKVLGGMPRKEAVVFFKIGSDTLFKWLKKYDKTKSFLDAKRKIYSVRKIDSKRLLEALEKKPDATLKELANQFDCWPQAIFRRLKKLKITRKKNHAIRRKK